MAKNCYACQHLEYFDDADSNGHEGANAGWGCNKREPTALLVRCLSRAAYRNRSKPCFEAASAKNGENGAEHG